MNIKKFFLLAFLPVAFLLFINSKPNIGLDTDINKIDIKIRTTEKSLELICNKGCDWEKLEIPFSLNDEWIVDSNNGTMLKVDDTGQSFIFKILRLENGIELSAIKGLNWKGLKANCEKAECLYTIDEDGVTVD
jgi:hypothetical protein